MIKTPWVTSNLLEVTQGVFALHTARRLSV